MLQVLVKNSSATWFSWVSNYMPILCNTTVRIHTFCETYISGQHRSACNMRPCECQREPTLWFLRVIFCNLHLFQQIRVAELWGKSLYHIVQKEKGLVIGRLIYAFCHLKMVISLVLSVPVHSHFHQIFWVNHKEVEIIMFQRTNSAVFLTMLKCFVCLMFIFFIHILTV